MSMLLFLLALGLLWMAMGAWLHYRGRRVVEASGMRRRVDKCLLAVGEELEVEIELEPPVALGQIPERDLVIALDRSGSMGSGPASLLGQACRAAEVFLDRCPPQLRVGLVIFNQSAEIKRSLGEPGLVCSALRFLRGEGRTSLHLGIDRCREEILEHGRPGVGKTIFLLSDGGSHRGLARAAAERLQQDIPEAQIVAAGLGGAVDRVLLGELAGGEANVVPVDSEQDFDRLFLFLAHRLAGSAALSVAVDEGVRSPRPFHFLDSSPSTNDIQASPTRVRWSMPVLDPQSIKLSYHLVAECPGWHQVASDLSASWSMPEGTTQSARLGPGPQVMVLPPLLTWAWPVLNPLFFLLAGERFCFGAYPGACSAPLRAPASTVPATMPAALPAIEARPYRPEIEPTLVIGLGQVAESALCHLRHRLDDRGVPPGQVEFRWVDLDQARTPASFGGFALLTAERLELSVDFFPYLESLRRGGVPATRAWIPWQEWLASSRPHTSRVEPERRRARLVALQQAKLLEDFLRPAIERTVQRGGMVVLLGSPDDPVASGLLGEVAHISAGIGAGTSILLVAGDEKRQGDRAALERELSRFLLLRGDEVLSDRTAPPALARRLIDRLVVTGGEGGTASVLAETLYAMLAFRTVSERLQPARVEGLVPLVQRTRLAATVLPEEHLWRWVRDRTLVREVVLAGLEWSLEKGTREPIDPARVDLWSEAFWTSQGSSIAANVLVREGRLLLRGAAPEATLLGCLPFDAPPHEQIAFHRRERHTFFGYLKDWCGRLLEAERRAGRLGLALLEMTLQRLQQEHLLLVAATENLEAHPTLARLGRLGGDLFQDQQEVVFRLLQALVALNGKWLERGSSVAARLAADFVVSERALEAVVSLEPLRPQAEAWADEFGPATRARLVFEVDLEPASGQPRLIVRMGDRTLAQDADPVEVLRHELDRYRGKVGGTWFNVSAAPQVAARGTFRLGGLSGRIHPDIDTCLDNADPGYGGALLAEEVSLAEALEVVENRERDLPFAWPEEANANRIAFWLRQKPIEREPRIWSPRVVHFLREPWKLHGFLCELALGALQQQGEFWSLKRGECWQAVTPGGPYLESARALEVFEALVRQVVVLEVSVSGEKLPSCVSKEWDSDPLEALAQVELHPLAASAARDPRWATWRDVIQCLAVEYSHKRDSLRELV